MQVEFCVLVFPLQLLLSLICSSHSHQKTILKTQIRPLTSLPKILNLFLTTLRVIKTKFLTMTPKVLYDLGPVTLSSFRSYHLFPPLLSSSCLRPFSLWTCLVHTCPQLQGFWILEWVFRICLLTNISDAGDYIPQLRNLAQLCLLHCTRYFEGSRQSPAQSQLTRKWLLLTVLSLLNQSLNFCTYEDFKSKRKSQDHSFIWLLFSAWLLTLRKGFTCFLYFHKVRWLSYYSVANWGSGILSDLLK